MGGLNLRSAQPADLAAVVDIERLSFPSPWDARTFEATIQDRRCVTCLAFENGMLAGYCFALCLNAMVHILNLAVHPFCRGKGIGRRLVQEILNRSIATDKVCAVLEVRQSNMPARDLYVSMGFSHVSTWRGYYSDTNEDAAIMVKDLRAQQSRDVECVVLQNAEAAYRTFHLVVEGRMHQAVPGQFVMVQVSRTSEPFLRRPLAVLGQNNASIELLYRVKGSGTEALCRKRAGDTIRLLGPLGNGFTRRDAEETIYLAGGTGLPPVLALAERTCRGTFILGAKTRDDIPLLDRITTIRGTRTIIMTEDGSFGEKGLATDALRRVLNVRNAGKGTVVYACGPDGMLREGMRLAAAKEAYCEVSLEERMSCGFGACAGCAVKTRNGTARVCREGPVFAADDISRE